MVSELDICLGSGLALIASQNRKAMNWREMAGEKEDTTVNPLQPHILHGKPISVSCGEVTMGKRA